MASPSRLRPRAQAWHFGSARFLLSVAAIVRSGLHDAKAFALLPPGRYSVPPAVAQATDAAFARSRSCCCGSRPIPADDKSAGLGANGCRGQGRARGRGHGRHRGLSCSVDAGAGGAAGSRASDVIGGAGPSAAVVVGEGGGLREEAEADAAVAVRGEKKTTQQLRAITRGLNSITAYAAYGHDRVREKTGRRRSLTVAEEMVLVEDVKLLNRYLKAREELEAELDGRQPTREEWASRLAISPDELSRQMMASARAQERIVEANVGLIKLLAHKHHPATMAKGTIMSDVIQEGSLALLRAAETFDPQLGHRFSTYAGWWVRDRVTRCVTQQARIIRLPQYVHNFRRTASVMEAALHNELGRTPTYAEIAERMEVDVERVRRLLNCQDASSLDDAPFPSSPLASGGGGGVGAAGKAGAKAAPEAGYRHKKVACTMVNPEQRAEADLFESKLDKLMNVLSEDEKLVVKLRYGLGGSSPTTLTEVAQRANSTAHRVRVVETRALNKLRRRPEKYFSSRQLVARSRAAGGVGSGGVAGGRRPGAVALVGGVISRDFS